MIEYRITTVLHTILWHAVLISRRRNTSPTSTDDGHELFSEHVTCCADVVLSRDISNVML